MSKDNSYENLEELSNDLKSLSYSLSKSQIIQDEIKTSDNTIQEPATNNWLKNIKQHFSDFCVNLKSNLDIKRCKSFLSVLYRIFVFAVVSIPFLLCAYLFLFVLAWITVFIAIKNGHDWFTPISTFVPFAFRYEGELMLGTWCTNLSIGLIAIFCLIWNAKIAFDELNANINSYKKYLIYSLPLIIICILSICVITIPSWYMFIALISEWIFKILLGLIIFCIVVRILQAIAGEEPEYDIIQIFIPRK